MCIRDSIKSISYPNNKAKNLAGMARMLCEEFGGEVPSDLKELQRLPGVGRKTANVVGAVIWQKEVMPVDTHVFRVSNRIGLTNRSKTPLQTELTLEKYIPSHLLPTAHPVSYTHLDVYKRQGSRLMPGCLGSTSSLFE